MKILKYILITLFTLLFLLTIYSLNNFNQIANKQVCPIKRCPILYSCGGMGFVPECQFNPIVWYSELRNGLNANNQKQPEVNSRAETIPASESKISVEISSQKPEYSVEDPVMIDVKFTNNTKDTLPTFFGGCGETYTFYVGEIKAYNTEAICYIGPFSIAPGEVLLDTKEFNLSTFDPGTYNIKMDVEGHESNIIKIVLK